MISMEFKRYTGTDRFQTEVCSEEDKQIILDGLLRYNHSMVPQGKTGQHMDLSRKIVDEKGEVIGGIIAVMYGWGCACVDILWVSGEHRKDGLGSLLLESVENAARENGGKLIHLDTFDFQARDFYIKHGYELFGCLDDCPEGHKRYYLKKKL